jgi:hypothetical protein
LRDGRTPDSAVLERWPSNVDAARNAAEKALIYGQFAPTERRRNRTFQPPGYDGLPVFKTEAEAARPARIR